MALIGWLLDFYGPLLTNRQEQCLKQHYEEDLSLAEIAIELGITRQAVHDNLQRGIQTLEEYEDKLHLVAAYQERQKTLNMLRDELSKPTLEHNKIAILLEQLA